MCTCLLSQAAILDVSPLSGRRTGPDERRRQLLLNLHLMYSKVACGKL